MASPCGERTREARGQQHFDGKRIEQFADQLRQESRENGGLVEHQPLEDILIGLGARFFRHAAGFLRHLRDLPEHIPRSRTDQNREMPSLQVLKRASKEETAAGRKRQTGLPPSIHVFLCRLQAWPRFCYTSRYTF